MSETFRKEQFLLPKNITEIETDSGKFRLIYGPHNKITDTKTIEGTDAIILEQGGPEAYKSPQDVIQEEIDLKGQYHEILQKTLAENKTIFFIDTRLSANDMKDDIRIKETLLPEIEHLLGVGSIIYGTIKLVQSKKPVGRRNFLKIAGSLMMGAYLGVPPLESTARDVPDENSISRKFEKARIKGSDALHPELHSRVVHGRNFLFAQKAETISQILEKEKQKKPTIGIVVGADHVGIESALQKPQNERMREITKNFGKENVKNEGVIVRIDISDSADGKKEFNISLIQDPAFNFK